MSPSAGEYDYIVGGVFTHPRPGPAIRHEWSCGAGLRK
jgi:hypothetical protein